jgi:DNA-binding helix-hairpin-helix protein with protein kinase domain
MSILYDSVGNKIQLAEKIGSGGEGNVYKIASSQTATLNSSVAKIYHQKINSDKQQKIKAMIKSADKALKKVTAWPLETLHKTKDRDVCGFIMPNIMDCEPLHHIYSPSHRKQQFPEIDWTFLANVCRNIASAFGTIHATGHVIGDVNPNLVFISKKTMVTLIDCDSFQISYAGKTYPCEVGVPHFTPPELQHFKSFKDIPRTINHDNFGLSLLIFHILMMGRHPFSGIYAGKSHMPLEKLIQQHLYAFSDKSAKKDKISPPPNSITPAILSDDLKLLFEKSFSEFGSKFHRPSAKEWISALDSFLKNIKSCRHSKNHTYYNRLSHCPWCQSEGNGIFYFPPSSTKKISLSSGFKKDAILENILLVSPPEKKILDIKGQLQSLLSKVAVREISKKIAKKKKKIIFKRMIAVLIVFIFMVFFSEWMIASLMPFVYFFFFGNNFRLEKRQGEDALVVAKQQLKTLIKRWHNEADDDLFVKKMKDLNEYYNKHNNIKVYYQSELKKLKKNKRKLQLTVYLEKFHIENANIKGVGSVRKSALTSFGIETAADVEEKMVMQIPGFGKTYTKDILDWRKGLEKHFVFDPAKAIDPLEINKVKIRVIKIKQYLEKELLIAPEQLVKIRQKILQKRKHLLPLIDVSLKEVAQAKADLNYLTQHC